MKIGFFGLLILVLIVLKLVGYISLSWWWLAIPVVWYAFVIGSAVWITYLVQNDPLKALRYGLIDLKKFK